MEAGPATGIFVVVSLYSLYPRERCLVTEDKQRALIARYTYEEDPTGHLLINFNDTWGWAMAYGEEVPDDEIEEVARLIFQWGWAGLLYWCSEKNDAMRSEFLDNNRCIDFVRHEEQLIASEPSSSKRAYTKLKYTLGEDDD